MIVQNKTKWIPSGSLTSIDNQPILNATQSTLTFQALLLRDCGDDDICVSDLNIDANLILPGGECIYFTNRHLSKYSVISLFGKFSQ